MKPLAILLAAALAATSAPASAACVAEYKAKQDNPLRLDHGVITVPDSACTKEAATPIVQAELAQRGWTLLSIISVRSGG